MSDNGLIKDDALFIDGTKLQADANIYSFTWKKAIDRNETNLNQKVSDLYEELIQSEVNLCLSQEQLEDSSGIEALVEAIEEELAQVEQVIAEEKQVPKGGSVHKRRRRTLKKYRNKCIKDLLPRKQK